MNNQPLVSIVITSYNRQNTIAKAIESALQQDYENTEIIISDNCSTDNSHQIICNYTHDKRIKYFRNETNIGMLGNFKISFEERAKGDYITIVNSDDELINPQFISQCISLINKYNDVVIVKCDHVVSKNNIDTLMNYNSYNEFYNGIDFLKQINLDIDFGWAGILLHKKLLDTMHVFDEAVNAADYIANFKMLLQGNICFNKNASYKYYLHSNNASHNSYSVSQVEKLFIELDDFFYQLKTKVNNEDYTLIEHKIKSFYVKSIYHLNYLNNRKDIRPISQLLTDFDRQIFEEYQKMPTTKQFKLLFYFPKLGQIITKIKKQLY